MTFPRSFDGFWGLGDRGRGLGGKGLGAMQSNSPVRPVRPRRGLLGAQRAPLLHPFGVEGGNSWRGAWAHPKGGLGLGGSSPSMAGGGHRAPSPFQRASSHRIPPSRGAARMLMQRRLLPGRVPQATKRMTSQTGQIFTFLLAASNN